LLPGWAQTTAGFPPASRTDFGRRFAASGRKKSAANRHLLAPLGATKRAKCPRSSRVDPARASAACSKTCSATDFGWSLTLRSSGRRMQASRPRDSESSSPPPTTHHVCPSRLATISCGDGDWPGFAPRERAAEAADVGAVLDALLAQLVASPGSTSSGS
jgi:hypothetical protein